jgi:phage shock protein PspC (stress-responsive transcriptional regulator)
MLAIWQTRPARRQSDRKIAGVAAAIARRYDIDPVLVRIGLVVAAFYGVGILIYLAAWVALPPDPNDRPRGLLAGKGSSAHPLVLIAAVVACLAGAGSLMSGSPGVLVGLAVAGGLLYLLHQARGERGLAGTPPAAPTDGAVPTGSATAAGGVAAASVGAAGQAAPGGAVGVAVRPTGTVAEPGRQDPPAWDPLGAAPFAWDLPEPGPPPDAGPPPPRRRSRITMATLGLALVAGGITAAIALPLAGVDGMRLVLGVMLAVVGLGLLVGALRHSGRALIVVAIPLLLLSYGVTRAPVADRWKGAGNLHVAPTTLAQLAPSYGRTIGSVTLDLRKLDLDSSTTVLLAPPTTAPTAPTTGAVAPVPPAPPPAGHAPSPPAVPPPPAGHPPPPRAPSGAVQPDALPPGGTPPAGPTVALQPGQPARTVVNLEVGDITVLLPPNVDVTVHCRAEIGDVNCLGQHGETDGPTQDVTVQRDLGADGVPSGRALELELLVRTGDVEVRRG